VAALQSEHLGNIKLAHQLAEVEAIVKRLDADIDVIAWQLRPAALDNIGLGPAIKNHAEAWAAHFDVLADVHVSGRRTSQLTREAEIALYRIMQEALNNVAKHARARNASVVLQHAVDHVLLIIEDDGVGFDVDHLLDGHERRLGLSGMRERATLVGGTIEVESQAGHGTTVIARVPTPPSL
jgi:signal transduction histidine kinase